MLISLIIFVILSVFAAYFASNNLTVIDVSLLGYPLRGTTGTLMVSALGIGVLLGVLMMLPALISRSWAVIRHRRRLQDFQDLQAKKQRHLDGEDVEKD
jgi:uncharacterized membrane protein